MLVGIRNKELTTKIGIMNLQKFDRSRLAGAYVSREQPSTIDDPTLRNGFMVRRPWLSSLDRTIFYSALPMRSAVRRIWFCRLRNWAFPPASFHGVRTLL